MKEDRIELAKAGGGLLLVMVSTVVVTLLLIEEPPPPATVAPPAAPASAKPDDGLVEVAPGLFEATGTKVPEPQEEAMEEPVEESNELSKLVQEQLEESEKLSEEVKKAGEEAREINKSLSSLEASVIRRLERDKEKVRIVIRVAGKFIKPEDAERFAEELNKAMADFENDAK